MAQRRSTFVRLCKEELEALSLSERLEYTQRLMQQTDRQIRRNRKLLERQRKYLQRQVTAKSRSDPSNEL